MNYSCAILFLLLLTTTSFTASYAKQHVYIVHLVEHDGDKTLEEIKDFHHSYLHYVKGSRKEAESSLIYSYMHIVHGFSALLTSSEATQLSEMEGIISVHRDNLKNYQLHTSRSWNFINLLEGGGLEPGNDLNEDLLRKANYGKDIIVGVLDSGIWPESASFDDSGMEPVPNSWKGICQTGVAFNSSHCNRKIIGARYYIKGYEASGQSFNETQDYRSARDKNSHGTHVASTVGGRRVPNASALGGFAKGTVSGGAPLVRLSIYKVVWINKGVKGTTTGVHADVLAAIEDAITDGVHVLSMSISFSSTFEDAIGIGALKALKMNIVSIASASNAGPIPSSVRNVAPWMLTVASSSLDREFQAPLVLGNGLKIQGQTATPFDDFAEMHPLIMGIDAEINGTTNNTRGLCLPGSLSPNLVKGKIVICEGDRFNNDLGVKKAGGAGIIQFITIPNITQTLLRPLLLPGITISRNNIDPLINYIRTTTNPMATLYRGSTILGTKPAPEMSIFSGRGPNSFEPNILKPDITAPGLNILAAWSEGTSPTTLVDDHRVVKYNLASGTSMSCPHVSALAVLIKAIHPSWSSAAIRSALMTTAGQENNIGKPIRDANGKTATPFDLGSGHVRPYKAMDPGLVYDATYDDYLLFLCSSGYDDLRIFGITKFKCPTNTTLSPSNLNYPSVAISNITGSVTVLRTVTNVGDDVSVYNVTVKAPLGYRVNIAPKTLSFGAVGEKKKFVITVKKYANNASVKGEYVFGWYAWSDGIHFVRSPIVVS
ncbi:subtilisin-like protease SBT5.6 isoform X2 [Impatiens glandulifera]|uniref:subtilisin-like protease SBT5.6 isoform X2 n=1 Tax=Impatiens glandulifera TaxID=253017 RepID=UPI001FB07C6A|nr:subtilisin-like protease SBT5.6 isoform X2 [Impatiens glandulifera]